MIEEIEGRWTCLRCGYEWSGCISDDAVPTVCECQTIDDERILSVCKCALADLEGIMPEFDPSGDRLHSGWKTIEELKELIGLLQRT